MPTSTPTTGAEGSVWTGNHLVVRERQPPAITALIEGHAGIDGLALKRLAVIGSQLDRDQQLFAEFQGADLEPVVKGRVLRGFEHGDVDVGLDAGLPQRRDVPLVPDWFCRLCIQGAFCLLLVIVQQIIHIVLIRLCAVGAPGLGNACRLLDGDPVPALGERCGKAGRTKLVGRLLGAEEGDVLLAERQVDLGEVVQGGKLARIHRFQPDVGHGSGDRLRFVWPPGAVLTLLHGS